MADHDDAREIEVVLGRDFAQVVGGAADVLEACRPAAAAVTGAPVLDVPGGDTSCRQRGRERTQRLEPGDAGIAAGQAIDPATAMDEDRDGMWTGVLGRRSSPNSSGVEP